MEITIRLSEFSSPEVIVINPELTAQETVQFINQKFNLIDVQTKLIVAPTSKKNGLIVPPGTVMRNLMFNPKQDSLELWKNPQFINVAIYFKEGGQDIVRDKKKIPVDFGTPLFKMIPTMQRAFELSSDQVFSFLTAEAVDDSRVTGSRWLNIQLSLEEQDTRADGNLLLFPLAKLVKTPETSLQVAEKAWLMKRSLKKDHTTNKQRRWFVLYEGFLFYYKKERESSAAGVIPLEYYVIVKGEKKKKHNIFLNLSKEVLPNQTSLTSSFKLQFENADLLNVWFEKIKKRCVNNNNRKIFGTDLKEVISRKTNLNKYFPNVVRECIEEIDAKGINQEGIFRLSASALTISHYKEQYDSGEAVDFSKIIDIHVAAGLLKLYLRELPEALFTFSLYDKYVSLAQFGDDALPTKIAEVLTELPLENYSTIKYLITFLAKVARKEEENKMGSQNLATVFGPNLIRHPMGESVQDFSIINKMIDTVIVKSDEIFSIAESLNPNFVQCPRFGAPSGNNNNNAQPNAVSIQQVLSQNPRPQTRRPQGPAVTVGQDRKRNPLSGSAGSNVNNNINNNNNSNNKPTPPIPHHPPNKLEEGVKEVGGNSGNSPLHGRPPPPNVRPPSRKPTESNAESPSSPIITKRETVSDNSPNHNISSGGGGGGGGSGMSDSPSPLPPVAKRPGNPPSPNVHKSVEELSKELEEERLLRKKLEETVQTLLSRLSVLEKKMGVTN